ncbi:MAG: PQQ-binding-like beta-propeller repeat protein, partial [Planctomycetaceae bacterium]|nr:PQQ-binding-like beta-propeller repeat protein [Planctomycetaceae bacterium]
MCRFKVLFAVLLVLFSGADSPQWGIDQGRNRISSEENLPVSFQPGRKDPATGDIAETGKNVRWAVKIGSRTYTPPVIADGCVLIGTNNDAKFDANIDGDYGIMLCLDEKTGKFRWQYAAKKVSEIQHFDTVQIGITSTPLVRNGIVYFVDNRGTVCAVNLADGKPKWTFDLVKVLGVRQHDANNCSITIHENWLFAGTANGLDARHSNMERPDAPTLVVLDAATGKPLARDDAWLKTGIVHGQWCSPCLGAVKQADGSVVPTLFYVLGNGILHSVNLQKFRQQLAAPPENTGQFG